MLWTRSYPLAAVVDRKLNAVKSARLSVQRPLLPPGKHSLLSLHVFHHVLMKVPCLAMPMTRRRCVSVYMSCLYIRDD